MSQRFIWTERYTSVRFARIAGLAAALAFSQGITFQSQALPKAIQTVVYPIHGKVTDVSKWIYPIPYNDLAANKDLVQNLGY